MRKQPHGLRNPYEIPVAGVTLHNLKSEQSTPEQVRSVLGIDPGDELLQDNDEVWDFRTPSWTWANMPSIQGFVVLRRGLAAHRLVTHMN